MSLVVYLDTQDYINFFHAKNGDKYSIILNEIIEHRDAGRIILCYSFAIIMEFITKPSDENRDERVRRGQLIKSLCGKNSLPYITELAGGVVFPNDGHWMLSSKERLISGKKFKLQLINQLRKKILTSPEYNRASRKRLSKPSEIEKMLKRPEMKFGRTRADFGDFPVSDEFIESQVAERFVKGQCSAAEFESHVNAWLSDPAELSRIMYDYSNLENMKDKFLGRQIENISKLIMDFSNHIAAIQEINQEKVALRRSLVEAGMHKSKARKDVPLIKIPKIDLKSGSSDLTELIGEQRVDHINHYIEKATAPGYRFLPSDIFDIFQMCYVYECDLFRCDKAMAHLFSDFTPFQGKLVPRLEDLPLRISDALST